MPTRLSGKRRFSPIFNSSDADLPIIAQLFSKFSLGAMSCNQAEDNYLGEKLNADVRPNDMPYSDGAAYTGKEHSWTRLSATSGPQPTV